MSFPTKDLIIAYRNQGMSYREIAEKTNTTVSYCRTIWSRANHERSVAPAVTDNTYCRYCGEELIHTVGKKHKQFCSEQCRNNYHNQNKLHKAYIRICENCGKEFVAYGYPKKRFCSRDCRTLAERKEKKHD